MKSLFACRFRQFTGLPCPSCGSTRAVLALLNGDPWRALRLNPIAFVAAAMLSGRAVDRDGRRPRLETIALVVLALGLLRAAAVALGLKTFWTKEHLASPAGVKP